MALYKKTYIGQELQWDKVIYKQESKGHSCPAEITQSLRNVGIWQKQNNHFLYNSTTWRWNVTTHAEAERSNMQKFHQYGGPLPPFPQPFPPLPQLSPPLSQPSLPLSPNPPALSPSPLPLPLYEF